MTRQVKASEFKDNCLALVDEVARTGEPIVIVADGKPIAELVAPRPPGARGIWKDSVKITGDIISPIDVEWEAMK